MIDEKTVIVVQQIYARCPCQIRNEKGLKKGPRENKGLVVKGARGIEKESVGILFLLSKMTDSTTTESLLLVFIQRSGR